MTGFLGVIFSFFSSSESSDSEASFRGEFMLRGSS